MKKLLNLNIIIALLSIYYILTFIITAALRIGYPYELQWMEGSILENVKRVTLGKPIYAAPTMEFVPYLYMPLYYYAAALLSKVVGLGFLATRLVSLLSALGCIAVIFLFIKDETRNKLWALAGIGLFCASYNICSGYFDVGRIDMLFVFFLLAGMYALRFHDSLPLTVISSLCFVLAFFTKQTALIVVIVLCVYLFIFKKKYRLIFSAIFACLSFIGCFILNAASHGWFCYYAFGLSSKHLLDLRGFLVFMGSISYYYTSIISLPLLYKSNAGKATYYIALLVSSAALTLAAMVNPLFDMNLFIPMAAVMAIVFGIGLCAINNLIKDSAAPENKKAFWMDKRLVYPLVAAQFVFLFYNPLKYIPYSKDVEAGSYLVQKISNLPGKVYVPSHPYLSDMAGREKYTHILPLYDMLELNRYGAKTKTEASIKEEFVSAVENRYFDYIILDNVNRLGFLQAEIEKHYRLEERIFKDGAVFWTLSGAKRRPEYIYVKK